MINKQERIEKILWENPWIEQLYQHNLKRHPRNRKVPEGMSDKQALDLVKKYKDEYNYELPDEYLTFLKLMNGYKDKGFEVFSDGPRVYRDDKAKVFNLEFGHYETEYDPDGEVYSGSSYFYDLIKGEYCHFCFYYEKVDVVFDSFIKLLFHMFGCENLYPGVIIKREGR